MAYYYYCTVLPHSYKQRALPIFPTCTVCGNTDSRVYALTHVAQTHTHVLLVLFIRRTSYGNIASLRHRTRYLFPFLAARSHYYIIYIQLTAEPGAAYYSLGIVNPGVNIGAAENMHAQIQVSSNLIYSSMFVTVFVERSACIVS